MQRACLKHLESFILGIDPLNLPGHPFQFQEQTPGRRMATGRLNELIPRDLITDN